MATVVTTLAKTWERASSSVYQAKPWAVFVISTCSKSPLPIYQAGQFYQNYPAQGHLPRMKVHPGLENGKSEVEIRHVSRLSISNDVAGKT